MSVYVRVRMNIRIRVHIRFRIRVRIQIRLQIRFRIRVRTNIIIHVCVRGNRTTSRWMLSIVSSLPRSGSVSLENWNSHCILAHFPPVATGLGPTQTVLYDINTADNNFVCLASSADRTKTPHLATVYDKKNKIPLISFKKYACAVNVQCSWCSNTKRLTSDGRSSNGL